VVLCHVCQALLSPARSTAISVRRAPCQQPECDEA
jgi:hypothetical protein